VLVPIDVRVLDHLIVGESIYSFADHGLLRPTAHA
jgi:DNA repair protein RadC